MKPVYKYYSTQNIRYLVLSIIIMLILGSCHKHENHDEENEGNEGWTIHADGSFDLKYGDLKILNCFPSINNLSIRPLEVELKGNGVIRYLLRNGEIIINLKKENGLFILSTEIKAMNQAPDWINPISSATVIGADRFYKQGFGFAGPSGIFPFPEPQKRIERAVLKENVWSYDSYLFSGLLSPTDKTLVISAYSNMDFLHRTTFYNRQHRIGLIDRHLDTDEIFIESGFATEEIQIDKQSLRLPDIYIRKGNQPFSTFQKQAQAIAKFNNVKLQHSPRYYYCSWYEFHSDFNSKILFEMLDGMEKMDPKIEIQTIQIDDGYATRGDWLNFNERFPEGMQEAVRRINNAGYEAGIWVGPFMVDTASFIFKEHKDWILKDETGNIWPEWPDTYILDTSHPDAFEYLRTVFRTFREMGITTFKTDFLDWGLIDNKKVTRYTPGKTSVQYFMDVIRMINDEIGADSYWLGCIAPFAQMIGFADGMRLSNDVSWNWNDETTGNMFREMYAGQFFNNVLWQNDPDALYLRDYKIDLSEDEKHSIALYNGIMGGAITTSCRFPTVNEKMLDLWSFIKPPDNHFTADLPFWSEDANQIVAVKDFSKGKAAYFVNINENRTETNYSLYEICEIKKADIYEWRPGNNVFLGTLDSITITLNPHESKLLYIAEENEKPPLVLNP